MWGWTGEFKASFKLAGGKPHVCGDGPGETLSPETRVLKTPRMWGWTVTLPDFEAMADENPTYVGMDRSSRRSLLLYHSKPHVCGDGPQYAHLPRVAYV